jgi:hypothetical protein
MDFSLLRRGLKLSSNMHPQAYRRRSRRCKQASCVRTLRSAQRTRGAAKTARARRQPDATFGLQAL